MGNAIMLSTTKGGYREITGEIIPTENTSVLTIENIDLDYTKIRGIFIWLDREYVAAAQAATSAIVTGAAYAPDVQPNIHDFYSWFYTAGGNRDLYLFPSIRYYNASGAERATAVTGEISAARYIYDMEFKHFRLGAGGSGANYIGGLPYQYKIFLEE